MYVGGGTAFFYAPYVFRPLNYGFCDFRLYDFLIIIKKELRDCETLFGGRCRDRTYDPLLVRQVL